MKFFAVNSTWVTTRRRITYLHAVHNYNIVDENLRNEMYSLGDMIFKHQGVLEPGEKLLFQIHTPINISKETFDQIKDLPVSQLD